MHRDVKPDNIVLCERGGIADVVKVLDFGLVKDVDAPADAKLSTASRIQGTPLYMAPEALTDPDAVDGRSDLYSLGAVAYYVLTGETLFGGTVVEVFGHHLHTRPQRPSDRRGEPIERGIEEIVMRCLEKRPEDRFESAASLGDALQGCVDAEGWTRRRARAWWEENRSRIASRRDRGLEPSSMTISRA